MGEGRPHSLACIACTANSCYLLRASPTQTSIYSAPPVCQARCPGWLKKSQPAPALPELPSEGLTCRGPGWFHFTEEKTEARDGESESFMRAGAPGVLVTPGWVLSRWGANTWMGLTCTVRAGVKVQPKVAGGPTGLWVPGPGLELQELAGR